MTIKVLSVASEAVPLVKTGGLADVVGALPGAVAPHGIQMTSFLPGYPSVLDAMGNGKTLHNYDDLFGCPASLVSGEIGGYPLIVLKAPDLFGRAGGPYGDAQGQDWPDNWRRFAAFAKAAADLAARRTHVSQGFDVLHAHDWQAGLAPAYLRFGAGNTSASVTSASVMTIHNMSFQGSYGGEIFGELGLPDAAWSIDGVEHHGGVNFLKAGLQAADAITTVSPTYSGEIRDPVFGMGLEGLIQHRSEVVSGIINGIDTSVWNPQTDTLLPAQYEAKTLIKRSVNKQALEAEFALTPGDGPIFIVISRLTWQKGMDVLLELADFLVSSGARLALLGSGDRDLEAGFCAAALRHPGKIGVRIGYDEALSHRMQGGGDAILIPSRFEPCGLTQLYGLAYGCVPVVARTGGLADSVIDANLAAQASGVATGVQFVGVTHSNLAMAITRTVALFADRDAWARIQQNGMAADFSWGASGKAYADLYKAQLGRRGF